MGLFDPILRALGLASAMTWEIAWALILGFALSAVVQAVVSKAEMGRLLPDDSPRTIAIAAGLGAASSSCSYAAVALGRSVFQKGANFSAAIAFEFASTNLVVELGIVLALLMGWQFTVAEFVGGPIMIVLLALLFRVFLNQRLLDGARAQAEQGLRGSMEGHARMDMSVSEGGNVQRRRQLHGGEWVCGTGRHSGPGWAIGLPDPEADLHPGIDRFYQRTDNRFGCRYVLSVA